MQIGSFNAVTTPLQSIQPAPVQNRVSGDQEPKEGTPAAPLQNGEKEKETKNSSQSSYLDDPALREMVNELKARDAEVRAHEAAHVAAGAGVVSGGANYTYQKGPDGRMYAIGGEVPIDLGSEGSPEATAEKMRQVKSAAMAPANPSPTDFKVAATAMMLEMRAQQEAVKQENKTGDSDAKRQVVTDGNEPSENNETDPLSTQI